MFIELPPIWIVTLNVLGIPLTHLVIARLSTALPSHRFKLNSPLFRTRRWEQGGKRYQTLFKVRAWKDRLPDGAKWFSGFAKGRLQSQDPSYLNQFAIETCRGESSHWWQMMAIACFVIWNPFPANLIIVSYAILSNLPCIIVQRHTRGRLRKTLSS